MTQTSIKLNGHPTVFEAKVQCLHTDGRSQKEVEPNVQ